MPFTDLHLHPTLKCLFSNAPGKLSPWDKIDIRKIPPLVRWCSDFQYILQSQSCLTQLINNDYTIVCIALYVPERALLENNLILGEADGSLKAYLNKTKIQAMIHSVLQPYRDLVFEDIDTILNNDKFNVHDRKVIPLKLGSATTLSEPGHVHAVFSVEGCHTLSSALRKFDIKEILHNLDDLASKLPVFSLHLTHLEQSGICNHAFGILFLEDESFKPTGYGISNDGIQIIKHCYQAGILVDIKHMSLHARLQFYELRQTPEYQKLKQPLICTHAGFTGISTIDIPAYIGNFTDTGKGYFQISNGKPVKYGRSVQPSFNASSINLYDEDIMQILVSGGIIGFSLDKRILGFHEDEMNNSFRDEYPVDIEFISEKEKNTFFQGDEVGSAFLDNSCLSWQVLEEAGKVNPMLADYHLHHFLQHIIHLIIVATNNNYDIMTALQQICIASDFDGIINPLWCCDTTDEIVYFKEAFDRTFEAFAEDCNISLPGTFDLKTFSDGLFNANGTNFILSRFHKVN